MVEFITQYPELVKWLVGLVVGLLVAVIGGLFTFVLFLIKMNIDRLMAAIAELKADNATDRTDIGLLKDRLATVEATCTMQRAFCPRLSVMKIANK